MKAINVMSLFNGMGFCKMALDSLGVNVDKFYSSEIDKYANQATQAMFPDVIQVGDILNWRDWDVDWKSIDLVTGGFPCQAWSMAGKQLGDKDERGMLFWVMLDIMKHVRHFNPKADFLIENVRMKKEFEEYITTHTENALGNVYKALINSALVSAQNRNRYYWTSFEVGQPEDKGILLKDIIEHDVDESFYHTDKAIQYMERGNEKWMQAGSRRADRYTQSADKDKAFTITANIHKGVPYNYFEQHVLSDKAIARMERKTYSKPKIMPDKTGTLNTKNNSGQLSMDSGTTLVPYKCGSMIGRKINPETGKRDDYNPDLKTEQRIEVRGDEKTGTLTTVQKDNLVVMSVNNNDRVKGISENERGYRPHKNDASKSGISELGRTLKDGADKTDTVTTSHMPKLATNSDINNLRYRKLTPRECFRLQTVPEHHIDTLLSAGISNTQLYKMAGNGWTMEVITHIFKGLIKE